MPTKGVSAVGAVAEDAGAVAAVEVTLADVGVTDGRSNLAPWSNV